MTRMDASDLLMSYVATLVQAKDFGPHTNDGLAIGMKQHYTAQQLKQFVTEFHPAKCPCGKPRCRGQLALAIDACLMWVKRAAIHRVEGSRLTH